MLTLFGVIGVLLALFSVIMMFVHPGLKEDSAPILKMWNSRFRLIALSVGLGLLLTSMSMFYANPGHQYYLVSPFGTKSAVFNSGYHFIVPGTRIQEWEKFVDIKVIDGEENTQGIEGVINGGIPIRFIDQVKAKVKVSVRMQLPVDPVSFIELAEEFRHPENLVHNTLVPTVKEQVINTGYMFAAQDYISGAASDFRQTLDDQLKNGGFSVEKKEYIDTAYVNDDIQDMDSRQIREITTRYEVEIRTDNGRPIRIPHDITKNNVLVSQVIVDELQLEEAFQKRLEKQRDIASQKRIELEAVEAAKIAQQKIIAEGERDKAAERVTQEKDQVQKLIAIETKVKEEESKRQLAQIALETEKLDALRRKVAADAKRYELQQANGLSEEEKYRIDAEVTKTEAMARAIENAKFPEVFIENGGSGSNKSGLLESLIGAELAKKTLDRK